MYKMNSILCYLILTSYLLSASTAFSADLTGGGATFPYPIYAKWVDAYKAKTSIELDYKPVGSGGGIKLVESKAVDFGASDMPLKPEELNKKGLMQFPTVIGGVVPVININGIDAGKLKLTGETLADIYLGKITKWNDPKILADNMELKLPDESIAVVYRTDSSGTTFIFTNYLSKVSNDWKSKVGEGTIVQWPLGVGGKGNEGVASAVDHIKNSIGYVQFAYVLQNKLALRNKMKNTQLKNHDGYFVNPEKSTFKAAAAYAHWGKATGFYELLTDEHGKESWPITGATFILMNVSQDKKDKAMEVLKFFDWAYTNGGKLADELDYVTMPENVQSLVRESWSSNIKDASGNAIWK